MALRKLISYLLGLFIFGHCWSYMRVCYYTNWSQFATNYRFFPARIPPLLCTHIIFAYADIRAANITPNEFNDVTMYARLNRLKRDNPSLQIILAVGGWAAGGERFSRLVSREASMSQFTTNLINYTRRHGLDGINIDWEYPTSGDRGSDVIDRERYTRLLQIIQQGFSREASNTGLTKLSLSAALETDIREAGNYYQIQEIGKYLDFGCLMAYDMHGQWDSGLGALHHSPLDPEIRTSVLGWIQAGFPAEKLVLGVAGFGRSFSLTSEPSGSGLGQPVSGGGSAGAFSREPGLLDYGEICLYITRDLWTRIWLPDRGVPVAYGNTSEGWQWVGYDDPESLTEKSVFIRERGLAGVMFWSLEHDDFSNLCDNGTWPLLRTLARELPTNSSLSPSGPLPSSTSIPSSPSTTTVTLVATSSFPVFRSTISTSRNTSSTLLNTTQKQLAPDVTTNAIRQVERRTRLQTGTTRPTPPGRTLTTPRQQAKMVVNWKRYPTNTTQEDRQCKMAELSGPSLTCPATRSKPGDRRSFYLYCISGFFAIECYCLPGTFFSPCLQTCDLEENFNKCAMWH